MSEPVTEPEAVAKSPDERGGGGDIEGDVRENPTYLPHVECDDDEI